MSSYLQINTTSQDKTNFVKKGTNYYVNTNVAIGNTTPTESLDVSGSINVNGKIKEGGNELLPYGSIMLWSGTIATIPGGWALCNGSNGTPDLRNMFVVGANVDSAGIAMTTITGTPSQSGGSKDAVVVEHTHSGTTTTNGSHTHTYNRYGGSNGISTGIWGDNNDGIYYNATTSTAGSHYHTFTTDSTGTSGTNANLPPYYALAYVMKIV
jgi:hypothetical protein